MDEEKPLWEPQRQEVTRAYEKYGAPYIVSTKPYHSTRTLRLDLVDHDDTAQYAYLIARPQKLEFFAYGVGDNVRFGSVQRTANDADTNLAKSRSTNGAADLVIEGIGFHCRGYRAEDGSAAPFDGGGADTDVVAAIAGERPIVDPSSIYLPPQVYSPFNLENAIFNGLLGYLSVELEWDRGRVEKLGTMDLFPQAGGASLLRSNGLPASKNRYAIQEGYLWKGDGKADSELIVRVQLEEAVVIPVTLNDDPEDAATVRPSRVDVDLVCRLFGFEFKHPSRN